MLCFISWFSRCWKVSATFPDIGDPIAMPTRTFDKLTFHTENTTSKSSSIVACLFAAVETRLLRHCLALATSSYFITMAFSLHCHIIIILKHLLLMYAL
jgi:hypothetical protein